MQTAYFETTTFGSETAESEDRGPAFGEKPRSRWDRFLERLGAWLSRSGCTDEEDYWTALMLVQ